MTLMDALMIVAVLLGPTVGVVITRWLDNRRERHSRRMEVFKTLMKTRRTPIHPEHVGALNLIEIEFAKEVNIIKAWRDLFNHLAEEHPRRVEETTSDADPQNDKSRKDNLFDKRIGDERQKLLTKLLYEMAGALNFRIEQLEIFDGGYTPQGWEHIETEQQIIRNYAVSLYAGRASIPVSVFDYRDNKQ